MTTLDNTQGPAEHATELANALDEVEATGEITLSMTDATLAAAALRHYADWFESNT